MSRAPAFPFQIPGCSVRPGIFLLGGREWDIRRSCMFSFIQPLSRRRKRGTLARL